MKSLHCRNELWLGKSQRQTHTYDVDPRRKLIIQQQCHLARIKILFIAASNWRRLLECDSRHLDEKIEWVVKSRNTLIDLEPVNCLELLSNQAYILVGELSQE
jgi:hypothetical protein